MDVLHGHRVITDCVIVDWDILFQLAFRRRPSAVDEDRFWYTLSYLWHVCRCGILVRVVDGTLDTFIPFANRTFRNNWKVARHLPWNKRDWPAEAVSRLALPPEHWWCNAGLLSTACGPYVWGTSFLPEFAACLQASAARIPDVDTEFFLNKRDFPNVRTDGRDPYGATFFGQTHTAVDLGRLLPVLSAYTGSEFADIPMPLMQDYCAFAPSFPWSNFDTFKADWETRQTAAVFRGSVTGCGTTPLNNPRLALDMMVRSLEETGDPAARLFDVRLTGRNSRLRKHPRDSQIRVLPRAETEEKRSFMSIEEQRRRYKYAIYVEGHSAASRMGALLEAGFLVFAVDTVSAPADRLFYWDKLIDGVHFVRCCLADLPMVVQQYADCENQGVELAWAATNFREEHLSPDAIEAYVACTLKGLS